MKMRVLSKSTRKPALGAGASNSGNIPMECSTIRRPQEPGVFGSLPGFGRFVHERHWRSITP